MRKETLEERYERLQVYHLWVLRPEEPDSIGYSKAFTDEQVLANLLGVEC